MPKYLVLQPIEKKNVLYVPGGTVGQKELPSGGHGKPIPVNASGEIELTEEEAGVLIYGQVPLFDGKPDPVGGAEDREKNAREDAKKAAAEKAEYEEFVAFRAVKAARKEKAKDAAQEKAEDAAQEEAEDRADEDAAAAKDEAKAAKAKKEKK